MAYRKTEFVERKRLETRERIVTAAIRLLARNGWRGCVLKAIAEEAGVATGSIYTHFGKIADLHQEVYALISEIEREAVAQIAAGPGGAKKRLVDALSVFISRALRGRVQAFAMMGEPVPEELEALRQSCRRRLAEPFAAIIQDGLATGDFDAVDPATAAACMLGAINETLISPMAEEAALQPDRERDLRRRVLSFCLRAVGAAVEARSLHADALPKTE